MQIVHQIRSRLSDEHTLTMAINICCAYISYLYSKSCRSTQVLHTTAVQYLRVYQLKSNLFSVRHIIDRRARSRRTRVYQTTISIKDLRSKCIHGTDYEHGAGAADKVEALKIKINKKRKEKKEDIHCVQPNIT